MATFPLPDSNPDPAVTPTQPPVPTMPVVPPPPADFDLNPPSQPSVLPLEPSFAPPQTQPQAVSQEFVAPAAPVATPPSSGFAAPSPQFQSAPEIPQAPPEAAPELASAPPKKSPFRIIVPILLVAAILGVIAFAVIRFVLPRSSSTTSEPGTTSGPAVTLTYYGLWEPPSVMNVVLDEFERQNPNIKVDYQMQQSADYRERLQTLLGQKTTPDVIRFHSTWIPMLISNLSSSPASAVSPTEISANFYPAVADIVIKNNQVYGVPTTLEGLGLFVNQPLLDTAQITPPKTWEDLRTAAKALTQYDPTSNQISQAGVALGTTANVDHWPDIVSLMLLQNGVNMSTLTPETRVAEALRYYTFFTKTDQVWSDNLPNSVQAFAAGKVAMILAPSWQALTIKDLNPSLSWKIYPVPQLPDSPEVTWVNYWIEGVPKNSAHQAEAWKLIKYLASSQAQQLLFDTATKERGFGQAPANKALAATVATNPIIGPYVASATNAKTFYTTSFTHDGDTGINSRLIKYLEDALNSYKVGTNETNIIPTLQQGFYQVLSQFNIVSPTPAPVQ